MAVKAFRTDSVFKKALLAGVGILCFGIVLVAAKWLFGNAISTQAVNKDVAQIAVGLAPDDPQTHFALAVMYERSFLPEDLPKSLSEYEKSVALSPYDYRLWLALGKAKERAGDVTGAESALKTAINLAPYNSQAKWAFGNVLLRQGKNTEAFKEIRAAVENDPKFAGPAATAAWQILGGDIEKVKQTIGDSPHVNSSLASFLAKQKRFDEAFEVWNSLPKDRLKTEFKGDSTRIVQYLLAARKYKKALLIQSKIADRNDEIFELGTVSNGGFESNVKTEKPKAFEWKIAPGAQPKINISGDQRHGGSRSLVLSFNATKQSDFRAISQTVAVEGGKSYTFEAWYKSDLDASTTMKWEVYDTVAQKVVASTELLEASKDWTRLSMSFDVAEESEGIIIRLARARCESTVCPIKGSVWFDDISIS